MSTHHRSDIYTKFLRESIDALQKSADQLRYSIDRCAKLKPPYQPADLEAIEALTARFARTVDIFLQKAIKSLFKVMREDSDTLIDKANLLEKIGIAESADHVMAIRELRNEIAHDYSERDIDAMATEVMKLCPSLFSLVAHLDSFATEYVAKHID